MTLSVADMTARMTRTAADRKAVAEGCYFDLAAAQRVREFFRTYLRHSKGQWAGQPFELLEWQWKEVVAPLFGWKRRDGRRRFTRAYIEIPKKNGKSTLAAGVGLYMLIGDGEAGAEVYSVAADRSQARIVHDEAVSMVKASSRLDEPVTFVHGSTHDIRFPATRSSYRALSSAADTKEGLNAHCVIIDELHAWHGRGLYDALRYAGRARRQSLLFQITTAGNDPQSVCREQHEYARGILAGTIEDTRTFAYIRAARQVSEGDEADDDWRDPETWRRANPSLGVTIDEEDFAADVAEASNSPSSEAAFKRYGLNIWSTSTSPWLPADSWAACADDFTAETLRGQECFGGLDLSKTRDMTALVLVFPDHTRGGFRLLPFFWLPEDVVYAKDAPAQYRVWEEGGWLETTPGATLDYAFIRKRIVELFTVYNVLSFAYDPNNAEKLTQELVDDTGKQRYEFRQTMSQYADPTSEFERLVLRGEMRHPNHPILTWQAGHVEVYTDANNYKRPNKPRYGEGKKIDGIVAAIMGLSLAVSGEGSTAGGGGVEFWD